MQWSRLQMLSTVMHAKALEENAHCACPACPPKAQRTPMDS